MYKPRYKYFTHNRGNIVDRIMSARSFNAYEFMSLRYACCEIIAEIRDDMIPFRAFSPNYTYSERRDLKNKIKLLQRCINKLDSFYRKRA
jgi:hypothetical protein